MQATLVRNSNDGLLYILKEDGTHSLANITQGNVLKVTDQITRLNNETEFEAKFFQTNDGILTFILIAPGKSAAPSFLGPNGQGSGAGGGGGRTGVYVEEEGVQVNGIFKHLNFIGTNVTVTDAGAGVANITITAGISSCWQLDGNTVGAVKWLGTIDGFDLPFRTNSTEWMRILTTGEVGIGITAPLSKLHAAGAIRTGVASATNGSLVFQNSTNANTLTINSGVTSASHSWTLPLAQGAANSVLTNNGSGVLSWGSVSATAWMLDGNTVGAEKWIGTIDNFALPFRTNNVENMILDTSGNLGIGIDPTARLHIKGSGATSATYALKVQNSASADRFFVRDDGKLEAGILGANLGSLSLGKNIGFDATIRGNTFIGVDIAPSMTSAQDNVSIGWESMNLLTTGYSNVSIGMRAGKKNTDAINNTNIGASAGENNISGVRNVAIGTQALYNNTGDANTSIGYASTLTKTSGYQNTALGGFSLYSNSTGNLNVAIGYSAGYYETGSSKLFIDNDSRTNEATARTNSMVYGVFNTTVTSQLITFNANTFINGRLNQQQGADAASASTLTLTGDGNTFELTGTTAVTLITSTGWQDGSVITLVANENVTITNGTATSGANVKILLAGAANFAMTANDTLTLVLCSTTAGGQAWRELARTAI